jgi:DNA-binding beta-propeller fold protein YncE
MTIRCRWSTAIAVDRATHTVYTANAGDGTVSVIATA